MQLFLWMFIHTRILPNIAIQKEFLVFAYIIISFCENYYRSIVQGDVTEKKNVFEPCDRSSPFSVSLARRICIIHLLCFYLGLYYNASNLLSTKRAFCLIFVLAQKVNPGFVPSYYNS